MGLKEKAISGLLWSGAGTIGNGLISFILTILLSRLLTPQDFALIALLNVFTAICNVLVDSGFTQAIVRDNNPTNKDLSSVFWFNFILSLILYFSLFALSPAISMFYNAPDLVGLSRVVFLVIIFNSLTLIQTSVLKRELNFPVLEKATVLGTFISATIAIILAYTGFGIWALVANMVLMPLFRSVCLWSFSNWRPLFVFSIESIKKYFHFGIFLTISSLVDVTVTNLNNFFIGKVYTKDDLGYYSQGGKLDTFVVTPLSSIFGKVVYPVFSKLREDENQLKQGYRLMIGVVLFFSMPVLLFVSFNADSTIVFFFGEKWQPSGVYLQLFSILGLFQLIHMFFWKAIEIKGATKSLMFFNVIKQSIRVLALILTINISVYAMTVGFVLSGIIGSCMYVGIGMYYLKYSLKEFLIGNCKTIITTFISIFLSDLLIQLLDNINMTLAFIIDFCIMILIYWMLNLILRNNSYVEFRNIVLQLVLKSRKYG